MNIAESTALIHLAGGLALFLFAIGLLSSSLRDTATRWVRRLIGTLTQSPLRGGLAGAALGTLLHSSATTVLLIGFLDAGLLTLRGALAPVLGANIGTTFAMQIVSFRIADYWALPLISGLLATVMPVRSGLASAGRASIAFGLLLLGLNLMSASTAAFRPHVVPWIDAVDGSTARGLLLGILTGLIITVVLQSSGATIGMALAMIDGGIFTRLDQVYPLLLGAHIGTCTTALLASLRRSVDARRLARFHLAINIIGTLAAGSLAVVLVPLFAGTADGLRHQVVNAHTGVMLLTMLPLLPFTRMLDRIVSSWPVHGEPVEPTHLDPLLLPAPEQALSAAIRELRRVARMARTNLNRNQQLLHLMRNGLAQAIERDEDATDEIQRALQDYLVDLTPHPLSRRQSLMLQHLERCMIDIERMADHNTNLCEIAQRRYAQRIELPEPAVRELDALFQDADRVLELVIQSLDPDRAAFSQAAAGIMSARADYKRRSAAGKAYFLDRTAEKQLTPLQGLLLSEYVLELDRLVRHSRLIARLEMDPDFAIDRAATGMPSEDRRSNTEDFP